jgi:hypothetical protein
MGKPKGKNHFKRCLLRKETCVTIFCVQCKDDQTKKQEKSLKYRQPDAHRPTNNNMNKEQDRKTQQPD